MADSPLGSGGTSGWPTGKPEVKRSGVLPPPVHKESSADCVVVKLSAVAKEPPGTGGAGNASSPNTPPGNSFLREKNGDSAAARADLRPAPGTAARRAPVFKGPAPVTLPPKTGVLPKLTTLADLRAKPEEREATVTRAASPALPPPANSASVLPPSPATPRTPAPPSTSSPAAAARPLPTLDLDDPQATKPPAAAPAAAAPPSSNTPAALVPPVLAKAELPEKNPPTGPPPLPVNPADSPARAGRAPALRVKPLQMETATPEESIFGNISQGGPVFSSSPPPAPPSLSPAVTRAPGLRDDGSEKPPSDLLPPPVAPSPAVVAHAPPMVAQPPAEIGKTKHRLPPPVNKAAADRSAVEPVPPLLAPPTPHHDPAPFATSSETPSAAALFSVAPPPAAARAPEITPVPIAERPAGEVPASSSKLRSPEPPPPRSKKLVPAPPPKTKRELPAFLGLFARRGRKQPLAPPRTPGVGVVSTIPASSPAVRPATIRPSNKRPGSEVPPPVSAASNVPAPSVTHATLPATAAAASILLPAAVAGAPSTSPVGKAPSASVMGTALPPPVPGATGVPRAGRLRRKRIMETVAFYVIFLGIIVPLLFVLGVHFSSETRVEGQVIPPRGTMLSNEVWIVSDFRELATGIADDLAADRAPKIQEIQERQEHVQRAQADIAAREERIRLLNEQMQGAKDEIATTIKQAHDAAQKVWDGPGAELEAEYNAKLTGLGDSIAARARSLKLNYTPDNSYQSPEVWANAYRLALYQTPAGVDGVKEHQWIEQQVTAWRAYTKSFDDQREKLRLDAAQIQLSPTPHVTDLNSRIADLEHRIESTQAEEVPLKTELQQAQADVAQAQAEEEGLDAHRYQQLDALPEQNIATRLPLAPNGRFSWPHMEKDSAFSRSDKIHSYWLFARAVRSSDGRQYWVMTHFSIAQNSLLPILIEPASFISTRSILRPDLPPDDQL